MNTLAFFLLPPIWEAKNNAVRSWKTMKLFPPFSHFTKQLFFSSRENGKFD